MFSACPTARTYFRPFFFSIGSGLIQSSVAPALFSFIPCSSQSSSHTMCWPRQFEYPHFYRIRLLVHPPPLSLPFYRCLYMAHLIHLFLSFFFFAPSRALVLFFHVAPYITAALIRPGVSAMIFSSFWHHFASLSLLLDAGSGSLSEH